MLAPLVESSYYKDTPFKLKGLPEDVKEYAYYLNVPPERTCLGRWFSLNRVRPITRWRRLRAWLGWHERDTLR